MRILLASEEQQLLSVISDREPFGARDRALILLALHTGLRSCELCSLNGQDVLTREGIPRQWVEVVGKGNRRRCVPLNARARQCVLDLVDFNRRRGFSVAGESPLLRPAATNACPRARCGLWCNATGSGPTWTCVARRTPSATQRLRG